MLALFEGNSEYFSFLGVSPTLAYVEQGRSDVPPGYDPARMLREGYFSPDGRLCAVLFLLPGYPTETSAYIGLLMVDASLHGRGLGTSIVESLLGRLADKGYRDIRLAVLEKNLPAARFWEARGFVRNGTVGTSEGEPVFEMAYSPRDERLPDKAQQPNECQPAKQMPATCD